MNAEEWENIIVIYWYKIGEVLGRRNLQHNHNIRLCVEKSIKAENWRAADPGEIPVELIKNEGPKLLNLVSS
jgi:hypothetical protein